MHSTRRSDGPLFARGSDTSEDAAKAISPPTKSQMRGRVLDVIRMKGALGATCDELEFALSIIHQTCSARVTELRDKGLITDSKLRRVTRQGRRAVVWVLA